MVSVSVPVDPSSSTVRTLDDHRRSTVVDFVRRGDAGEIPPPARVVLCHPALLVGRATAAALDGETGIAEVVVVGSATDLVRETSRRTDVALVSESLGTDVPELLQALAYRRVAMPVVVMTHDATPDVAAQYLEWGAAGSVDVGGPVSALVQAVLVAGTGAPVVDDRLRPEIVRRLADRAAQREQAGRVLRGLSPRERHVLESLARGTGVADISRGLHLSPHTIRACIRSLGPRLGVAGQLQLAAVARGLLRVAEQPPPSRYLHLVRGAQFGELSFGQVAPAG